MTDCVYLCLIIIPKSGDYDELPFELCCREIGEQNSHMLDLSKRSIIKAKKSVVVLLV